MSVFEFCEISSHIKICAERITHETDTLILQGFSRYGFSEEWLRDPQNRDRVTITRTPTHDIYSVDGEDLFSIGSHGYQTGVSSSDIPGSAFMEYKYNYSVYLRFIKEV